jgi:hypothetical protein
MGVKTYRYILCHTESIRDAYEFFDSKTNPSSRDGDPQLRGQEIFHVEDKFYSSADLPAQSRERIDGRAFFVGLGIDF